MTIRKRGRRVAALVTLLGLILAIALGSPATALGAPALAQVPGVEDCKQPPNPERPGSGMVGAIDPTPLQAGAPNSVYAEVGYAGLVWHTYDLGCGPSGLRNPNAVVDTWTGNLLFDIGKVIVGAKQRAHGGELGRYLAQAVINRGKPSQHVVISTAHRLADGIRAHGVFTRCAIRVGLAWTTVGRLVGRDGGQDRRRWGAGHRRSCQLGATYSTAAYVAPTRCCGPVLITPTRQQQVRPSR